MTIPATASQIPYAGDGVSVSFPIPFVFDTSDEIGAVLTDSDGVPTRLTSGYSITGGSGATGTLVMDTAPANGETLTVFDDPPLSQTADYPDNDAFPAPSHEQALDRVVRQVKRLKQQVDRTLRMRDGDNSDGDDNLIPLEAARAGKFLSFDVNGNPTASAGTGGGDSALRTDLANGLDGPGSTLIANKRTALEILAGKVPANYLIPSHEQCGILFVERYQLNSVPGTTDMSAALQSCVDIAMLAYSAGRRGIPIRFFANAYKIVTPPTFGAATGNMRPLDIGGVGTGTQIINAAGASTPTFDMSNVNGWYLHDMLLTGNSTHPNDGIKVNAASNLTIRWRIERIVSMMAGRGIVCSDTNTGVIRDFKHWPDNGDALPTVAPVVTTTDIDHGIFFTGSFVHDISVYDADCFPRDSFKANACGIRCDASGPNHNIRIIGGMFQGNAGNGRNGISLDNCYAFKVSGAYHESSVLRFSNATNGIVESTGNGEIEGKLLFAGSSINNLISGCRCAELDLSTTACVNNTIENCGFATSVTDAAKPRNRYINVVTATGFAAGADRGGERWIRFMASPTGDNIAYSASMTPDMKLAKAFSIEPNNSTAFTVNEPSNPLDAEDVLIVIKNDSGGALGTATFGAQYKMTAWTQPANGFYRWIRFKHNKAYGSGVLWWEVGRAAADIPV